MEKACLVPVYVNSTRAWVGNANTTLSLALKPLQSALVFFQERLKHIKTASVMFL